MKTINQIKLCILDYIPGRRHRISDFVNNYSNSYSMKDIHIALLELQQEGKIILYRLDNPAEIKKADKESAISLGGDITRHIFYIR